VSFLFISFGLIFSGYLSAVKFFTDTCALNEPCPYFLGYPACWYGFGMYLIMFIAVGFSILSGRARAFALATEIIVSGIGVVFSGSFVIRELLQKSITGSLGLSTCAYGFIFYLIIFSISTFIQKSLRRS
jgi:hypothetical protein